MTRLLAPQAHIMAPGDSNTLCYRQRVFTIPAGDGSALCPVCYVLSRYPRRRGLPPPTRVPGPGRMVSRGPA